MLGQSLIVAVASWVAIVGLMPRAFADFGSEEVTQYDVDVSDFVVTPKKPTLPAHLDIKGKIKIRAAAYPRVSLTPSGHDIIGYNTLVISFVSETQGRELPLGTVDIQTQPLPVFGDSEEARTAATVALLHDFANLEARGFALHEQQALNFKVTRVDAHPEIAVLNEIIPSVLKGNLKIASGYEATLNVSTRDSTVNQLAIDQASSRRAPPPTPSKSYKQAELLLADGFERVTAAEILFVAKRLLHEVKSQRGLNNYHAMRAATLAENFRLELNRFYEAKFLIANEGSTNAAENKSYWANREHLELVASALQQLSEATQLASTAPCQLIFLVQ